MSVEMALRPYPIRIGYQQIVRESERLGIKRECTTMRHQ